MPELKAGDTRQFSVGGQTIIVEPIPFGRLKKLLKIIEEVSEKASAGDAQVLSVPKLLNQYGDTAIPLLFDSAKHPFLNKEWIDDHLTIPALMDIVQTATVVNGIGNFFGKTATPPAPEAVSPTSGIQRTLQENSSSTTPSDSPTDGNPQRLTN